MRRFVLSFALLVLAAAVARAQDSRLDARFTGEPRASLQAVLDSARRDGIPTEPLVQHALYGASRGHPSARVVVAVRGLAERMRRARAVLGRSSSEPELVAGASALFAGVEPAALERLRRSRRDGDVTLPLIVLTDIVERGVPADTAAQVIVSLGDARVTDADFQSLRQWILSDIRSGAAPSIAAMTRARGVLAGRGMRPPEP